MGKIVRYIFWVAFLVSFISQDLRWVIVEPQDTPIWVDGIVGVQTESPGDFPKLDAYMHPGGPVIEGAVFVHDISKVSDTNALLIFLIIFDSLLIAWLCVLCYILRKDILWPVTVLGLLSLQSLYNPSLWDELTPPSLFVAIGLPILTLITLYICENPTAIKTRVLVLWCAAAGFVAAARIDAGGVMAAAFFILLATIYDLRKACLIGLGAFAAFCAFDPFMWFGPITQIKALLSAIFNHYGGNGGYISVLIYFGQFPKIGGTLATLSVLLAILFVLFRDKIVSPVPVRFLVCLLFSTALLAFVFLSAQTQATRYFIPLLFIWEVLLPLFVFYLISNVEFSFIKTPKGQERARLFFKIGIVLLLVVPLGVTFISEAISHNLVGFILR